ncbi:MAG: hypothetical protein ACR2GG_08200 [Gemmatimonadaceae bacterium]
MFTRSVIRLGIVVALFGAVPALRAQSARPIEISVAGGATLKQGGGEQLHGLAALGVKVPILPFTLRFDGVYTAGSANAYAGRVSSFTANLLLPLARGGAVSPYLIGGTGLYATPAQSVRAGWNVGAGVDFRVSGARLFAESRFHDFGSTSVGGFEVRRRMIPLSVGIRF